MKTPELKPKRDVRFRSSELVSRWRRMAKIEMKHAHQWATGDNWKLGTDRVSAAVCESRAQILEMCAASLEAANAEVSRPAPKTETL